MQQEISFDLLRRIDPNALCPATESRIIYFISKRILDFSLGLLALIFLLPVIAIVAILIKLDSTGPIFFVQDRVTVKRRIHNNIPYWQKVTFRCYKFRSMVCNADSSLHKSYIKALINNDCESMAALQGGDNRIRKLTHDPRITRLGKFIRKSSIDEVPQCSMVNSYRNLITSNVYKTDQ